MWKRLSITVSKDISSSESDSKLESHTLLPDMDEYEYPNPEQFKSIDRLHILETKRQKSQSDTKLYEHPNSRLFQLESTRLNQYNTEGEKEETPLAPAFECGILEYKVWIYRTSELTQRRKGFTAENDIKHANLQRKRLFQRRW